jgi:hypothetical protein
VTQDDENKDLPLIGAYMRKYSLDEIVQLKIAGEKQPDDCPDHEWRMPTERTHQHDLMILMASYGHSTKDIAEYLDVLPITVNNCVNLPENRTRIRKAQERLYGKDIRKRIQAMLHKSLDLMDEVLDSPTAKEQVRVDVAKYLLDQGVGKAKQEFEHSGSLLAEFLTKLDDIKDTSRSAKETKVMDSLETFVDELGVHHVVGEKNEVPKTTTE